MKREMTLVNRWRWTLRTVLLVSLVAMPSACARNGLVGTGSPNNNAGQPTAVTSPTTPAAAPSANKSAAASQPPATTGGNRCHSANLRVEVVPGPNAAGHFGLLVVFTNTSSNTCTMYGYPGVSFLTGSGVQINDPAERSAAMGGPSLVSVPAGGKAHANVLIVNVANYAGSPTCQPTMSARMRVYPPDETMALYANTAQQICEVKGTGVPVVYPVRPGATSS